MRSIFAILVLSTLSSCLFIEKKERAEGSFNAVDSLMAKDSLPHLVDSSIADNAQNKDTALLTPSKDIDTKNVHPADLVTFAKTLIGTPYVYGSTNPSVGFDCSGFITHVFNHFGIAVPRSSIDFTNVGTYVPDVQAKSGDIILFTGTDSTERFVGHMGIIVTNDAKGIEFIHSTSGKAKGVTITPLNDYYRSRFVKIIRIFPQNNN